MKRKPKVLGRVLLTASHARDIRADEIFELPSQQFRQHIRAKAYVGDLVWAQEPFTAFQPKRAASDYGILVGPVGRARHRLARKVNMEKSVRTRESGKYLRRVDSCVTLEIMGVSPAMPALRCHVHMMQVDAFLHSRRAA